LELQLLDTQDPPAQVDLLRRIATLRQTRLGEAEGAFDAWSRAMRIDPSSEFQERLEDLTSITGDFEQLVAVYKEVLPNLFDPPRMVELRLRIAQICGNRLDDDAGAEEFYLAALEVQEDNEQALHALEALYSKQGAWEQLLGILE